MGTGTVRCGGAPARPGEGMGCRVPGAGGRYLGAVEVAAVRIREPARPAGALVDGHVPQLDVHPHDAPAQRDGVGPGGRTGRPSAHLVPPAQRGRAPPLPQGWLVPVHGLVDNTRCQQCPWTPCQGCPPLGAVAGAGGAALGREFCLSRRALTQPIGESELLGWPLRVVPCPAGPTLFPGCSEGVRAFPLGTGPRPLSEAEPGCPLPSPAPPTVAPCVGGAGGAVGTHQPGDAPQVPGGAPARPTLGVAAAGGSGGGSLRWAARGRPRGEREAAPCLWTCKYPPAHAHTQGGHGQGAGTLPGGLAHASQPPARTQG